MATSLQIQNPEIVPHSLDRTASPREEARILLGLIGRNGGDTVESIRELIEVPPEIKETLTRYAHKHPEDASGIERVITFRKRVAEEFEKLLCQQRETVGTCALLGKG